MRITRDSSNVMRITIYSSDVMRITIYSYKATSSVVEKILLIRQVRYRIKNDTDESSIFSVDANSGSIRIKTDEPLTEKR